jgi:PPM family protein phosphatase
VFTVSLPDHNDTLMLCSDGVWEPLSDADIAELFTDSGPLQATVDRACEAALDAGSRDNVTVVAARRVTG